MGTSYSRNCSCLGLNPRISTRNTNFHGKQCSMIRFMRKLLMSSGSDPFKDNCLPMKKSNTWRTIPPLSSEVSTSMSRVFYKQHIYASFFRVSNAFNFHQGTGSTSLPCLNT